MYIGIDVGGTYTDAVITDGKRIIGKQKFMTRHDDLLSSLLGALDAVVDGHNVSDIRRVVLSTTLITNIIAEKKYPPVALLLIPGPGMNPAEYRFDTLIHVISGAIDYRGREILPVSAGETRQAAADVWQKGYRRAAVVGKFSGRNNSHELTVRDLLQKAYPDLVVEMGHTVSGQLNFPRRIATTMLTAATKDLFAGFAGDVMKALQERNIKAPAFILKADGGTLPLESALKVPVETIFSGPAASTLGAMSLSPRGQTSVVADIGGTTTDLALILSGEPLLASKGAKVEKYLTQVRSFAVKSIPLGGDSVVIIRDGQVEILPERQGPAYCMGGKTASPTDALRYLQKTEVGDMAKATEIMKRMALETGKTADETAKEIVDKACHIIVTSIEQMFTNWQDEPAYRVWEIIQPKKIRPNNIVGVGGAAAGLIPEVAAQMGCAPVVPEHAEVANALGAAAAQPTITVNIRVDTEQGIYSVMEDGSSGSISKGKMFKEEDALKLAAERLYLMAEKLKLKEYVKKIEVVHSEVFNMLRGWHTTGRLYDVSIQTPRDILFYMGQEESGDV